jgi:hypothetical protein
VLTFRGLFHWPAHWRCETDPSWDNTKQNCYPGCILEPTNPPIQTDVATEKWILQHLDSINRAWACGKVSERKQTKILFLSFSFCLQFQSAWNNINVRRDRDVNSEKRNTKSFNISSDILQNFLHARRLRSSEDLRFSRRRLWRKSSSGM